MRHYVLFRCIIALNYLVAGCSFFMAAYGHHKFWLSSIEKCSRNILFIFEPKLTNDTMEQQKKLIEMESEIRVSSHLVNVSGEIGWHLATLISLITAIGLKYIYRKIKNNQFNM